MKPQTQVKKNKTLKDIKRAFTLNYLLKINGFSQKIIAEELNITRQAVSRYVNGQSKIARVENWFREKLGV